MGMTPEREKEIRKIAGRDGQTWRSSAVSLVALNDVIDELDELRGKVQGFKAKIEMRLKDAERLRAHSLNLGHFTDAEIQGYLGRQIEKLFLEGVDLGLFDDPLTKVPAQHFHDDCVFYANCPACVAGHAGVFNRRKP